MPSAGRGAISTSRVAQPRRSSRRRASPGLSTETYRLDRQSAGRRGEARPAHATTRSRHRIEPPMRERASRTTRRWTHPRPSRGVPHRGSGPALAPSPSALCSANSTPRGVAFRQARCPDGATTALWPLSSARDGAGDAKGSTRPRAPTLQCPANPCWDRVSTALTVGVRRGPSRTVRLDGRRRNRSTPHRRRGQLGRDCATRKSGPAVRAGWRRARGPLARSVVRSSGGGRGSMMRASFLSPRSRV
jgi:hypothetical protein